MIKTRLRTRQVHPVQYLSQIMDVAAVVLAGALCYYLRDWPVVVDPRLYLAAVALGCFYVIIIFPLLGVYREDTLAERFSMVRRLISAWVLVVLALVLTAFLSKTGAMYSRVWFVMWSASALLLLPSLRLAGLALLRTVRFDVWGSRKTLIVGDVALAREVSRSLRQSAWSGVDIVGFIPGRAGEEAGADLELPVLGDFSHLPELVARAEVDELWITLPLRAEDKIRKILHDLRHSTVTIRMVPDLFNLRLLNHSISEISGIPLINLCESPMSGANSLIKLLEDKLVAFGVLTLAAPLMLVLALAIKLSSRGPVIYRQKRVGWNGREFDIMKFRTMPVDSEQQSGPVWNRAEDRRATPIGAFLRRTSLDELPE